jgi:hypothetical protein
VDDGRGVVGGGGGPSHRGLPAAICGWQARSS